MDAERAQSVLNYVDPDRVLSLLQEMVRIPSPTFEEGLLAEYIAGYLDALDIETEMVTVEDPYGSGRRSKQPVGILRGDGTGPSLMFNGHMDHNMLAGRRDDWDRDPFSGDVDGEHLYGRGSIDEKGGIAGLLTAGEAIKKWGIPLKGDLILCPVMGHKSGAIGSRHHIKRGLTADMCINTETTDLGIITAGVGVTRIHILFKGRPVHFSSTEEKKKRAAFPVQQMAHFITRLGPDVQPIPAKDWMTFQPEPELPGFPQLSVDTIESQYMPINFCKISMQVRTIPGQSADTLRQDLERLLESLGDEVPNIEAVLEVPPVGGWDFPPYKGPKNHLLPETLARWHEYVSDSPADVGCGPRLGACGDANFIANTGVSTVQYGPGSIAEYDQWPAINERIKIEDLLVSARTMSLTAAEICGA